MNNLWVESFPFIFFSTKLWPFCSVFWIFFFLILFISTNRYLPSKKAPLKKFWWSRLEKLFLKAFFYTQKIIVPVREQKNHLLAFLSFPNKLIARGLFHPCFSNTLLPTAPNSPPYRFAFYPGMQDASTESPWLSNNTNTAATRWGNKTCTLSFLS